MTWVLDTETNERRWVADANEVVTGFQAGRLRLPAGERVSVIAPDGTAGTIDAAEFQRVVIDAPEGSRYRLPNQDQINREATLQRYADQNRGAEGLDAVATGLVHAANSAVQMGTGGLVDMAALARHQGGMGAEAYAAETELNPTASTVGDVTGGIAGAVFGPAAAAGGMLNTAASRAVGGGLRGAVAGGAAEGVAYGLGQTAGEAVADPESAGEHLWSNIGMGALFGGGFGAVAHGGARVAQRIADAGESAARSAIAEGERAIANVTQGSGGAREALSNQMTVRGMGARVGDVRQIRRELGQQGVDDLGTVVRRHVYEPFGDIPDLQTQAQRISDALETSGARVGDALERASARSPAARIHVSDIEGEFLNAANSIRREGTVAARRVADMVEQEFRPRLAEAAQRNGGQMTLSEAHEFRRAIDRNIRNWGREDIPASAQAAWKDVRGRVESRIEQALDSAPVRADLGDDLLAEYRAAKHDYRHLRVADDIVTRSLEHELGRNMLSPSVLGLGSAGAVAGAVLGGGPGAAVGAIASGSLRRLAQDYGPQAVVAALSPGSFASKIQATIGDNTSLVSRVARQVVGLGEETVAAARSSIKDIPAAAANAREAAKMVGRRARTAGAIEVSSSHDDYQRTVDSVREVAGNPRVLADRVARTTEPLASVAPRSVAAMAGQAQRAAQYLASRIPPGDSLGGGLQPHLTRRSVSSIERATFMRRVAAADDPRGVIRRVGSGAATREEIETLREVHPQLYSSLQRSVLESVAQLGRRLTWSEARRVTEVTGIPAAPLLQPAAIASMQATYAGQPVSPDHAPQPLSRPLSMRSIASSNAQREADV